MADLAELARELREASETLFKVSGSALLAGERCKADDKRLCYELVCEANVKVQYAAGELEDALAAAGVAPTGDGQRLERALAGLDYFLNVKEERRFVEGARAEVALALAAGVAEVRHQTEAPADADDAGIGHE